MDIYIYNTLKKQKITSLIIRYLTKLQRNNYYLYILP